MIQSFGNRGTEDVFYGRNTRDSCKTCPSSIVMRAGRKLDLLDSAVRLDELRIPPGNRLEPQEGNRQGQFSIRINNRYRICFRWTSEGPAEVEIVDYH